MPRGTPKRGEFDFTIWFADGSRIQWKSSRTQTNGDIAAAIRRYLVPLAERLAPTPEVVDRSGAPVTRKDQA